MKRAGLTLMEEAFCRLVAIGKPQTDAYAEAFGVVVAPGDAKAARRITKKASYLAKRPDVAARIVEAKGEEKRRDREMWEQRGADLANRLYDRVIQADRQGELLSRETLKGIEVLAKLKGLNAPEEKVITPGGSDDNAPRGIANLSDEDLDKVIAADEVIDVTADAPNGESEDDE